MDPRIRTAVDKFPCKPCQNVSSVAYKNNLILWLILFVSHLFLIFNWFSVITSENIDVWGNNRNKYGVTPSYSLNENQRTVWLPSLWQLYKACQKKIMKTASSFRSAAVPLHGKVVVVLLTPLASLTSGVKSDLFQNRFPYSLLQQVCHNWAAEHNHRWRLHDSSTGSRVLWQSLQTETQLLLSWSQRWWHHPDHTQCSHRSF